MVEIQAGALHNGSRKHRADRASAAIFDLDPPTLAGVWNKSEGGFGRPPSKVCRRTCQLIRRSPAILQARHIGHLHSFSLKARAPSAAEH